MIKIYRFGKFVNQVESEDELRQWIIANCPYTKNEMCVPDGFTLNNCKAIAREHGYSFEDAKELEIKILDVARLGNILNFATFPEVASDLIALRRRGMGFVGTCPHCHEKAMYIDPKHQIYKCFGCGETGNVVNFIMQERNLSYKDALNYLESKYCNN